MNVTEAIPFISKFTKKNKLISSLLEEEINRLRELPYHTLIAFMDNPLIKEIKIEEKVYQIEVEAFYEDSRKEDESIKVIVAVDDISFTSFFPKIGTFTVEK